MIHPTVFNTAQVCKQLGIANAVMSPGSRNAPLTISFARHKGIKKWVIPDERAAGFVALGIAQETKKPVALCCTSGSALLNYAPAVAEAYYREIPLIILSADRPPELIDQRDGQTIRQYHSLNNHVKETVQLPVISSETDAIRYQETLINTIQRSENLPKGPVHINIPFKEPFYPESDQLLEFEDVQIGNKSNSPDINTTEVPGNLSDFKKILILVGQNDPDPQLDDLLSTISTKVPIVRSPLNNLTTGIKHVDGFIRNQTELQPDLLITYGLSVLSKKLKIFLRKNKPKKHIHIDLAAVEVDTYISQPTLLKRDFKEFLQKINFEDTDDVYLQNWKTYETKSKAILDRKIKEMAFSETKVAAHVLASIPYQTNLHLSNSMPVRYADLFGITKDVVCYCNRGTSGIDGCSSTAVGTSLVSEKLNILITGDLAFLYDRNAFFHNYMLSNLRVIILNNQGGGIFRLIDGPSKLEELEEYFETRHNRTAEYICREAGFEYHKVDNVSSLEQCLKSFYEDSENAKIIEIFTSPEVNQKVYKELKEKLNE